MRFSVPVLKLLSSKVWQLKSKHQQWKKWILCILKKYNQKMQEMSWKKRLYQYYTKLLHYRCTVCNQRKDLKYNYSLKLLAHLAQRQKKMATHHVEERQHRPEPGQYPRNMDKNMAQTALKQKQNLHRIQICKAS